MGTGIEWGAVSDWVSGIATSIAVIISLVFSLRTERHTRDAKYAAIFSWFEMLQGKDDLVCTLWVANGTLFPVYEWRVRLQWGVPGIETPISVEVGSQNLGLLPPDAKHDFIVTLLPDTPPPVNDSQVKVDLHFRDALGRNFHRRPSGRLVRR